MNNKSIQILEGVDKRLISVLEETEIVLRNIQSLIRFEVIYGIRTAQEQFNLYKKGRKLEKGKWVEVGKVITYNDGFHKKSTHQEGKAVDIIAKINYEPTWDIEYYYYLASLIEFVSYKKGFKIKWGGWFRKKDGSRFIDGGHFEIE